jgi:hypothetical protein
MSASYLLKTGLTASTATSYTVSMWVKFTKTSFPSGTPYLWSCGSNGSGAQGLYMNNSMILSYYGHTSYGSGAISNGSLRDLSGWYHFVWSVNSGTGTLYINGVQQSASISNVAPLNAHGGTEMAIHTYCGGVYSTYDDIGALMSHVHFIDGTAYDASAFGETDANGVWKIKTSPSVTYGNNGFFILKDGNSVTDQSGNGNNFTASGTLTNTEDNPSNVFATFNPLDNYYAGGTFTHGNNTVEHGSSPWTFNTSTLKIPENTKFYCEGKVITMNQCTIGIQKYISTGTANFLGETNGVSFRGYQGDILKDNSLVSGTWSTFTTNDIIQIACDTVNNKLYFGKNGTWLNNGDPTSGASGTGAISITDNTDYFFAFGDNTSGARGKWSANFGNGYFGTTAVASAGTNASGIGIFEYDVPTGYTALSTKGLNL